MKKKIYVFAAACTLMSNALFAQSVTGKWNGKLDIQGIMKLRIVLNVKEAGGTYTATLLSPDQSSAEIPATNTTFDQGALTDRKSPRLHSSHRSLSRIPSFA